MSAVTMTYSMSQQHIVFFRSNRLLSFVIRCSGVARKLFQEVFFFAQTVEKRQKKKEEKLHEQFVTIFPFLRRQKFDLFCQIGLWKTHPRTLLRSSTH